MQLFLHDLAFNQSVCMTLTCRINQGAAFTGEGNTLGGGASTVDQTDAAAAREARARAAERRLAAGSGQ